MNLQGLSCLVVGGGLVSERKVMTLLSCGAVVTLVSPVATPVLRKLAEAGKIRYKRMKYRSAHAKGQRMIIGATDNPAVNEKIFCDAERLGIPVNIVDQPHLCRFIVPAVLSHRDIQITLSTGGAAPGVTAMMRRELGKGFFRKFAPWVAALKTLRPELRRLPVEQKKAFWARVRKTLRSNEIKARPAPLLKKWLAEIKERAE